MAAAAQRTNAWVVPGLLGLAVTAALARASRRPPSPAVTAARRLNRAAGLLALSVLADSAVEHYRGSFKNKAMVAPLVTATLALIASGHGTADRRPAVHWFRDAVYSLALATGAAGTGFHLYNVASRPGRIVWQNLFYGAPLGAPAALVLSGLLGFAAERVRGNPPGSLPRIFGRRAGRVLALITSGGLIATAAEAGLLHFRGAFQNPFMVLPVTVPPATAVLLARVVASPSRQARRLARGALRLTAALGFLGASFHAYGVSRGMGGWRNWTQNILNGPPIPAPPSFTGLALAGLAALGLIESHRDG
jgi:hypothetical protein